MSGADAEDAQYKQEVQDVKQWWSGSRWRYTRRPFTAEEIVAKRGNLKITYPSNSQSKKLWNIVEDRFKVGKKFLDLRTVLILFRTKMSATHMAALIPSWSRRWRNILIPSTSLDGKPHRRHLPPTNLVQIWLTILTYVLSDSDCLIFEVDMIRPPCQIRLATSSWRNSSMIGNSAKSVSLHPKPTARRLRTPTTCDRLWPTRILAMEVLRPS